MIHIIYATAIDHCHQPRNYVLRYPRDALPCIIHSFPERIATLWFGLLIQSIVLVHARSLRNPSLSFGRSGGDISLISDMSTMHAPVTGVFGLQKVGAMDHHRTQGLMATVDDGTTTDSDASADLRRGESDREDEDEEEEEVDDSVREDMKKLEDTFPGISDRFRLVNRIGEGTDIPSIFARSCPFPLGECMADL